MAPIGLTLSMSSFLYERSLAPLYGSALVRHVSHIGDPVESRAQGTWSGDKLFLLGLMCPRLTQLDSVYLEHESIYVFPQRLLSLNCFVPMETVNAAIRAIAKLKHLTKLELQIELLEESKDFVDLDMIDVTPLQQLPQLSS